MRLRFAFPLFLAATGGMAAKADVTPAGFDQAVVPLFEDSCYHCHGDDEHKGDLALDKLTADFSTPEKLRAWVQVLDKMDSGEMPPKKESRPDPARLAAASQWLHGALFAADFDRQQKQGRVVGRRLNRTEYENTVRELLGVETSIKDLLPADSNADGFDKTGSSLDVSSVLLEGYLEAVDLALDAALPRTPRAESKTERFSYLDDEVLMTALGSKTVFPRPDGVVMLSSSYMPSELHKFHAPRDGLYRVRVSCSAYQSTKPIIMEALGGDFRIRDGREGETHVVGYFDAPPGPPAIIEFTDWLSRNATFKVRPYRLEIGERLRDKSPEQYDGPGLAVQWVEVEGPLSGHWPPASQAKLFGSLPLQPLPETDGHGGRIDRQPTDPAFVVLSEHPDADAEKLMRDFVPRAYRRPVDDAEVTPFVELVRDRLQKGYSFEEAMRVGYKAVLSSPEFIFLREKPGKLDDYALASRLSYFLWATMPDAELLSLAQAGQLSDPAVLRAQTDRLLASPKARAFIEDFTGQWLDLRLIDFTTPDKKLYPEYDDFLKTSMVRETQLFFEEMLQRDLPVQTFIQSDFAMLNGRLAELYRISGVSGAAFRKVMLPPGSHRGGLLGQAAILKVTANGTNTSPVTRGKWVLDRVMGLPPPPPPKNVGVIEPDARGAKTIREQLDLHRHVEACAVCHRKIDPPGFALENFDVIGGWRERYRIVPSRGQKLDLVNVNPENMPPRRVALGQTIDASYHLEDGASFKDVDEFKTLLLRDPEQIARCLAGKLLVYATGAGVQFADRPVVADIVARSRAKGYGLRSMIHEVVQSRVFLNK